MSRTSDGLVGDIRSPRVYACPSPPFSVHDGLLRLYLLSGRSLRIWSEYPPAEPRLKYSSHIRRGIRFAVTRNRQAQKLSGLAGQL